MWNVDGSGIPGGVVASECSFRGLQCSFSLNPDVALRQSSRRGGRRHVPVMTGRRVAVEHSQYRRSLVWMEGILNGSTHQGSLVLSALIVPTASRSL